MNDPYLPHIHLWIPSLFQEKGGIQEYSSFFLQALLTLQPKWNYDVFLKHDAKPTQTQISNLHFHGAGQSPNALRTLAFASQILGYGLRQSPDLIISTHLNFTPIAHQLQKSRGIPFWTVAHGIEAWNIQRSSLKTALHHAERILAVSQYTRDRLLAELNLDPEKVCLLPNTFDANRFSVTAKPEHLLKKHGLKLNQPILLTVARLHHAEQYKGYDKILRALPKIRQIFPDVHYILLGKGDDRSRIEQLITQLHLQDCVTLTGYVSDEELVHYYNLCDIYAMPSKGEGFGIVYLEAMACGKPVLAGNQDGAMDALKQGELGVLVNPEDEDEIAHALIQMLDRQYPHPFLYQPESLRERVIHHFGFQSFQNSLEHYLQQQTLNSVPNPV
jgi:glycosyltransferase involved in cell wall biosynthesis